MKTTVSLKAMKAAIDFATRGEWPSSIADIQQKLALVGFERSSSDIAMDLDSLTESGLIGVFRDGPPDELG